MTDSFLGDKLLGSQQKPVDFRPGKDPGTVTDKQYSQTEAAAAQSLPGLHEKFLADLRDGSVCPRSSTEDCAGQHS